ATVFCQAEDGIRDRNVTGVQTCALPIYVALPRVRDFQGINPNSFDGRGNYALGIREQLIFPEIEYDKIDKIRGMDVVICTTAHTDEEARALLEQVGAPFAR